MFHDLSPALLKHRTFEKHVTARDVILLAHITSLALKRIDSSLLRLCCIKLRFLVVYSSR